MSFTLCSSYAIISTAGKYADSGAIASNQLLSEFCDEAEGEICETTGADWVTNYSSVQTLVKPALANCCACLAAIKLISYDPSGYTNLEEASFITDVLRDTAVRIMKPLSDRTNANLLQGV